MQELASAVNDAAAVFRPTQEVISSEFAGHPEAVWLQTAAGEWAKISVMTFTGDLLTKALAISRSIAEFTAELNSPTNGDGK